MKPLISIILGSDSDLPIVQEATSVLEEFGLDYDISIISAHRNPEGLTTHIKSAEANGTKLFIGAVGMAAHLPGVIASQTILPVIGIPILSKSLGGADALYSIVQMPPGVPVATVGINGAKNAGLLAVQILALSDKKLAKKLTEFKQKMRDGVEKKSAKLQQLGVQQYLEEMKKPTMPESKATLTDTVTNVLETIDIPDLGKKYQGKVRDFYIIGDKRITITTDRQSAFDVVLGYIPYKGAVLNQLAAFWFQKTKKIVPNHVIAVPDPNVLISKNCQPIPVEMVVRGYLSGVTKTSVWYSYEKGERTIYGMKFPNGMKKNQKLPIPIITPTTHPEAGSKLHDERLTRDEIIKQNIVPAKLYKQMEEVSLALFAFGQKRAKKQGLILVDTKYEFGLFDGKLTLIDEIHTPDSSRFWLEDTYKERLKNELEPQSFDKEFLRLWYVQQGYKGDGTPPPMPKEIAIKMSQLYIDAYEKITGEKFKIFPYPIGERIRKNLKQSEIL
ncbi:MAG: phosphoribosylaminoimidazolesuccinocarboxamide synthase [Patescibacteria group bacterium]